MIVIPFAQPVHWEDIQFFACESSTAWDRQFDLGMISLQQVHPSLKLSHNLLLYGSCYDGFQLLASRSYIFPNLTWTIVNGRLVNSIMLWFWGEVGSLFAFICYDFPGFYTSQFFGISKNESESTTFLHPQKTPLFFSRAKNPEAKRCCWKVDIKTSGCQWWLIRT